MHNHRDEGKVSVKLLSLVGLFATLWTGLTRLFCLWDSSGRNTGAGCHFLLQEIFPTQELNPYIAGGNLYHLSCQGSSITLMVMTVINRLCLGDEVKSRTVEKP